MKKEKTAIKPVTLTAAQQQKAVQFLRDIVETADRDNPGQAGYEDHEDTMKIRVFLIECGGMPDRRSNV